MDEKTSGAYIFTRGSRGSVPRGERTRARSSGVGSSRRGGGGGGRRGAVMVITVLLVLTACILLLVFLLPRFQSVETGAFGYTSKKFYFLVTAETDSYIDALAYATDSGERGGAGYLYNDGKFRIISGVYDSEADAKALVSVNAGSSYFGAEIAIRDCDEGDADALEYFCGEWFSAVSESANALDRGGVTEAAADFALRSKCLTLLKKADGVFSAPLKRALTVAADYDPSDGGTRSLLPYIRFVAVRAVVNVYLALSA